MTGLSPERLGQLRIAKLTALLGDRVAGGADGVIEATPFGEGAALVHGDNEAAVLERPPLKGYGFVRWWGSVGFIALAGVSALVLRGGRLDVFPILLIGSLIVLGLVGAMLEGESRPRRSTATSERVTGSVWVLMAILTLHQIAHGSYYAFFSIHLSEHGVKTAAVAALWSLAVLAELVAFVRGGFLQQRFGLRRLLGWALALTPLRWLLLALPPTLPTLVLAQAGHAVSFAMVHFAFYYVRGTHRFVATFCTLFATIGR